MHGIFYDAVHDEIVVPVALGGAVLAMLLLGLAATWIPAQRALSVDPLKLLREE